MADHLVQTRVPAAAARWLAKRATAEGDSVAGWLRRYIMQAASRARIRAWLRRVERCDPGVLLFDPGPCDYWLEALRDLPSGEVTFVLVHGEGHGDDADHPVTGSEIFETDAFRKPHEYRFVLEGSPTPWVTSRQWHNEAAERVEVALRPDHEYFRSMKSAPGAP